LNMHFTLLIIYIGAVHVNAKKWIVQTENKLGEKKILNKSGQDFSLGSPKKPKTTIYPTKDLNAKIGSAVQLICDFKKFKVSLSSCQFTSPTGEIHEIGTRCESINNPGFENLCMEAKRKYDPKKECGMIIRNLKLEDTGKWKCNVEAGGQWRAFPLIVKMPSSHHQKNRRTKKGCTTVSGPAKGVPCKFPFWYRGEEYKKCTQVDYHKNWCATDTDKSGNIIMSKWGNCDCQNCACSTEGCTTVSGPDPGMPCKFPFTYWKKKYFKCTDVDHLGNWCATGTDKDGIVIPNKWGNCDCQNCYCAAEGQGIIALSTKTGLHPASQTNDHVEMNVCDVTGTCCSAGLNHKDDSASRQIVGKVDQYNDPSILGPCLSTRMKGQLTATLRKKGSDGWFVEWAKIKLADGHSFTCEFKMWLDNEGGYTNDLTVPCMEKA